MVFIEGNLRSDEQEIHRSRLHWIVFAGPVVFSIPGFMFLAGPKEVAPLGFFFLGIALIWALFAVVSLKTSEFVVTNKRVFMKVGSVQRQSLEIFLKEIESIAVHQGILGRIFGYGSITVVGSGGSKWTFHRIEAPLLFRRKIQEQIAL
ncbi:MAG: PH domain-containing protein [Thermoanaerobaculaceae bacterium]